MNRDQNKICTSIQNTPVKFQRNWSRRSSSDKKENLQTNGRTEGRTDGRTYGRTDRRADPTCIYIINTNCFVFSFGDLIKACKNVSDRCKLRFQVLKSPVKFQENIHDYCLFEEKRIKVSFQ